MEEKGWLYYCHRKSSSSITGSVLQDIQTLLNPANRYVVEMKQNEAQYFIKKENDNDADKKIN